MLAWYSGHWVRSGGRLLVAPDREYVVRSVPWRRLDLRVKEDGEPLLDVHAIPQPTAECRVECEHFASPRHGPDEELLVTFMCVLAVLVHRQGREVRAFSGGTARRGT